MIAYKSLISLQRIKTNYILGFMRTKGGIIPSGPVALLGIRCLRADKKIRAIEFRVGRKGIIGGLKLWREMIT